ncbi:glycogen debranching protein GlgX [Clostridium vitabionis]|uniref:glycogen debranching protein GlgX n=1 Tax=Clostridium vitabionis TaxID=2784388 RepID=UPI00188BE1C5|nr:glycogen debranching protein GlgX [Clostridium vitabionis]
MRGKMIETPMGAIHMQPTDEIGGFMVRSGIYQLNGATELPGAVNFTVTSKGAKAVYLLLFHRTEYEPFAVLHFPEKYRIGNVYSMIVFDLDIGEFEYAYSVDGPWDPKKGLLFDRKNVLLDPYARAVTGQSVWGTRNQHFYKARVVSSTFDWGEEQNPRIPMQDLVIYEMHVRGFTRDPSSGVKFRGTFQGVREKIPYLRDLGVNAVELMPVFEFDETRGERCVDGKVLLDYWGYNPVSFFAPNTSYAADKEYNREGLGLKELVRDLNQNGIECLLDVVFNHTAEGNEDGPVFSFKGFDNNIYYMLTPDGHYYNFSGCGNTFNCNHPMVRNFILDCLRYWTVSYHIDGFRFDLASILGRNEDGSPMMKPPLLENLACDPLLGDVKLIAEAWDAGGLYQVGNFPARGRWSEWNGRYRDDMRNFLKGDYGMAETAARRITGSSDLYDPKIRGNAASVNFLNCHDGFTLYDLYAYSRKHNEANGWNNTDGTDDNRSWNCGAEGETDDPAILRLRERLCRNAMAVLLMSRGTPMFLAGDEFLNSQQGNNNAYCQDNEISWLNWHDLEKNRDFHDFVRFMIHFRAKHPVIRREMEAAPGLPSISTWLPDGRTKALRVTYAGIVREAESDRAAGCAQHADIVREAGGCGAEEPARPPEGAGVLDAVSLLVNVYWEQQPMNLPELPRGFCWRLMADTSCRWLPRGFREDGNGSRTEAFFPGGREVLLEPRSVLVFAAGKGGN